MTLVTIDLGDVAGGHDPDDHVVIRAEAFRESQGGGITSTAEVTIPLVDGVGQAEVEPGPVVVSFRCQAVADTREKRGVVPDAGPVGIEDVIGGAFEYTPPVVNRGLDLIEDARDEALGQVEGAVEAAVGEVFTPASTNLFDLSTAIIGVVLPSGSATETPSQNYAVSAPIPVEESTEYSYAEVYRVTFLDRSGNHAGDVPLYVSPSGSFTTPATATHMRLNIHIVTSSLNAVQVNAGPQLLPYEPYYPSYVPAERLDLSGVQPRGDYLEGPISPQDTTFFTMSSNLFTFGRVTPGIVIPSGTATPQPNATSQVSDPIPVIAGGTYSVAQVLRITFLSPDGTFMGDSAGTEAGKTFVVPPGATHLRLSINNARVNLTQLNEGGTLLPYERGEPPSIKGEYLSGSSGLSAFLTDPVHPEQTTFFDLSTNLVDMSTATAGVVLSAGSGTPTPNQDYHLTDPYVITPGEVYQATGVLRITWIGIEGQYVGHHDLANNVGTVTAPTGAAVMRASINRLFVETAQINRGELLLPYEEGGAWLKPERYKATPPDVSTVDPPMVDNLTGLDEVYDGPTIPAFLDIGQTTPDDVYGWYDDLVSAHPTYITRRNLGMSSDGVTPMYAYTLKPEGVPGDVDGTTIADSGRPIPACMLISGVHGYERPAIWHLWRFAKALCDEWAGSPVLDAIRWNFEVIIVPLGNPYGYWPDAVYGGRKNFRGVDIARNFPPKWVPTEPGHDQYSGTHPLSEPESQMLDSLMGEVSDRAVFGGSFHNFSSSALAPWRMIWQAAASPWTMSLGRQVIKRMSRKWWAEHGDWITTTDAQYLGYVNFGAPNGSEGFAFGSWGIPGSTFETSRLQYLDGGPGTNNSERAMTLGYEATVNYIAMGLAEGLRLKK